MSLYALIDYEFQVLPADSVLAYLDKRMPELENKNQEPFHPEQCGPCWFCAFKKEQR